MYERALKLLESEDAGDRAFGASLLGGFGERAKPAIPALVKAAGEKQSRVCRSAITALKRLAVDLPEALEALIGLVGHPSADVRSIAAWAFRDLGEAQPPPSRRW
jgi:HEAT repeat protein